VDFIGCVSSTCYLLYGHQLLHGNVLRDMTQRGMEWKTGQKAEQKMESKGDLSYPSDLVLIVITLLARRLAHSSASLYYGRIKLKSKKRASLRNKASPAQYWCFHELWLLGTTSAWTVDLFYYNWTVEVDGIGTWWACNAWHGCMSQIGLTQQWCIMRFITGWSPVKPCLVKYFKWWLK